MHRGKLSHRGGIGRPVLGMIVFGDGWHQTIGITVVVIIGVMVFW